MRRTVFMLALLLFLAILNGVSGLEAAQRNELPFEVGETLTYEIKWHAPRWLVIIPGTYDIGHITAKVEGKVNYQANPAYKFTLRVKSSGTLPKLTSGFRVDDYFESLLDARDFCSYRITKRIEEGRKRKQVNVTFDRTEQTLHIRELDMTKDPPEEKRNERISMPSCVLDIISVFYALRLKDIDIGQTYRLTVGDEGKVREVQLKVLKREEIRIPDGPTSSLKTQALGVFGGLFRAKGDFFLWLSDDEKRVPLKFEARVKYGRVYGYLKSMEALDPKPSSSPPSEAPSHRNPSAERTPAPVPDLIVPNLRR